MVCLLFLFILSKPSSQLVTLLYGDCFIQLMCMFLILSAIMTDKFMVVIDKSPAYCLTWAISKQFSTITSIINPKILKYYAKLSSINVTQVRDIMFMFWWLEDIFIGSFTLFNHFLFCFAKFIKKLQIDRKLANL